MARHLITEAVIGEDKTRISRNMKNENGWWIYSTPIMSSSKLWMLITKMLNLLVIEYYNHLDDCNTIRCEKHAKNCALQNVFKIFN